MTTDNLDDIFGMLDDAMEAATADVPTFRFDEASPGDSIRGVVVDIGSGESDYGPYKTITLRKPDGELVRTSAIGTVFAREFDDALAKGMCPGWAVLITKAPDGNGKNGSYQVVRVKAMPTGGAAQPQQAPTEPAAPATEADDDSELPF